MTLPLANSKVRRGGVPFESARRAIAVLILLLPVLWTGQCVLNGPLKHQRSYHGKAIERVEEKLGRPQYDSRIMNPRPDGTVVLGYSSGFMKMFWLTFDRSGRCIEQNREAGVL